jgi:hypothetical protein
LTQAGWSRSLGTLASRAVLVPLILPLKNGRSLVADLSANIFLTAVEPVDEP